MAKLTLSGWGISEDGSGADPYKLSSPLVFFWSMMIFLILSGFVAAILYRQIQTAFLANPGLNGLILGVLAVGVLLVFTHVLRLRPEVRWVNSLRATGDAEKVGRDPVLLAPMRALIGRRQSMALSTTSLRSILDSIATRLDESRDTSRYLIGLLVFLGLLGTFWGLLGTIGSINQVIQSLDPGTGGTDDVLSTLKTGLSAPLDGMGTAFSSSLFGLAGSLILGFLDLQAGRAQNRFYTELENWLSTMTDLDSGMTMPADGAGATEEIRMLSERMQKLSQDSGMTPRTTAAMASLAEGIQGLVKNMRNEQQMLRDWIEAQQAESRRMRETLDKLADKIGDK
ncbi:MAG: MotA/TolQ/ExbB proton channel family protein [Hoeflea sp.]|uniref:MotA/TolQ/ExbB proton channel family protein n=1 Tax=Hoeflea sp. TaxID=1940281 RepID=UPI001DB35781|nr:MotA/TolQ/ExbB proton channel family protein [Hoeflea sp.]MBU4528262.1 MotA/TolQ/ExbB proton channel family protein [Alphaproteobacteria bacterium]MBU4543858.1 MotA/TolQ/ExbB proton channel family protein [Alphaproteobacteria bacterium]MBU4548499.1 MotA/TolQ/ExbB proton channel family protein [Alphaproteobacteria bacterium]MBV1722578.1 MotA/TolQ/ExbB proton channel family protein [Hoeflea sp.]MBV1762247.1 MotA/TolQ/ExbB proton channel family protein [Hoeflea sp.]